MFIKVFVDTGYKVHGKYKCVVYLKDSDGKVVSIGAVTVDDGTFASTDSERVRLLAKLTEVLHNITYEIGDEIDVIGLHISIDRSAKAAKIQQKQYVRKLLASRGITKRAPTPATSDFLDEPESTLLSDQSDFLSLNASLMYAAKRTYPEILTAVTHLARQYGKATVVDMKKAVRVLEHMNWDVEGHCLYLRPKSFKIVASADASYAEHVDAKSHTGGCIGFEGANGFGSYFMFESSKQPIVTKSSTEAELVALNTVAESCEYLKQFVEELGLDEGAVILDQDNLSTMRVSAQGTGTYKRSKHIRVRYYWIKELIDMGRVALRYVPTKEMVADVLSKPVVGAQFQYLVQKLLGWVLKEE